MHFTGEDAPSVAVLSTAALPPDVLRGYNAESGCLEHSLLALLLTKTAARGVPAISLSPVSKQVISFIHFQNLSSNRH